MRIVRYARGAMIAVALLLSCADLQAQQAARPAPAPRDSIRIFLMTMGQGEQVYELFGHNAIWVHDPAVPIDRVYNWGTFDFNTPGFIPRFLLGDMRYILASQSIDETLAIYRYLNRQIWAQELNLTPAEKVQLVTFVRWNERPENKEYRYDYYLDNCSTRVRDAIDRVVGGAVRTHLKSIRTDETYRSHSLRLMQREKLLVSGVEIALGRRTDAKLSADEASFLPVQLMQYIRGVKLDGGARSLIGGEFVVYEATRAPEPTTVPALWKVFLPIGLALAAVVVLLGYGPGTSVGRRRALAAIVALFAGVVGIIGTIITLLVTVTDHVAAHANENMFVLNPLWLAIAIAAPMLILRGRARKPTRWLVVTAAACAIGAVLIHLVGMSRQPNWDVIGLLLPVELAIVWIVFGRPDTLARSR